MEDMILQVLMRHMLQEKNSRHAMGLSSIDSKEIPYIACSPKGEKNKERNKSNEIVFCTDTNSVPKSLAFTDKSRKKPAAKVIEDVTMTLMVVSEVKVTRWWLWFFLLARNGGQATVSFANRLGRFTCGCTHGNGRLQSVYEREAEQWLDWNG